MPRKMGLDLGDVNIGIAFSDPLSMFASGFDNYRRRGLKADLEYITSLIKAKDVDTIVVGLPINMDGTSGPRVEKTHQFCDELAKVTDTKIVFMDERLSTVSAQKLLISADVSRDNRKKVVDKVAASIILQNYLDKKI